MAIGACCRADGVSGMIILALSIAFLQRAYLPMRGLAALYTCCLLLSAASVFAAAAVPFTPVDEQSAAAAEQEFAQQLERDGGPTAASVLGLLGQAHYQQSVIDAITRPAEGKPWKDYRPIFVTERRIADGAAFYRANAALLARIEIETGVPAELVVTILGVETNYGRMTGRYRVLDALTTLAFHYPPRQDFFRSELKQLLLLRSDTFPYAPEELMGSYAGAMGWGQFMPSSVAGLARARVRAGKIVFF
jgi:membrane-bound lytic murein transglycosylase B